MSMAEMVYLDGSLVPRREARVSVFDHGFLYGYGLFETMRAYHGRIFLLERHLERLGRGAAAIGMGERLAGLDLARACRETLAANQLKDARVRLTVTNGVSDDFPWAGAPESPTVVITARPYTPFPPEKYARGFKAIVATTCHCARSAVSGIKSVNYLVNVLARREAAASGFDEALLLDDRGYLAEGGNSNVFFVRKGRLVTPSLESGILPGITRETVMGLAGELDISVREADIHAGELAGFEEAFMTSSMMEIMPLTAVRTESRRMITFGTGGPGEVTRWLMAVYRELVERETSGPGGLTRTPPG
jgi:branched-chain amino acid aminotransferase group I